MSEAVAVARVWTLVFGALAAMAYYRQGFWR